VHVCRRFRGTCCLHHQGTLHGVTVRATAIFGSQKITDASFQGNLLWNIYCVSFIASHDIRLQ
jgi:HKD family nuclease